ncbi:DNA polymerase I [Mycoplasmatota bacterium]|nr:DNA polymerase I [Mycoplasmatota bacterium]
MKKVILVDGFSLIFRAYYATAYTGNLMRNSKGVPTNCLFGFASMIKKLTKEDFSHFLVAFDFGKKTFRHDKYPEYKDGRSETPKELIEQIPYTKELCDKLGIKRYEKELYEADDIIGTLAKEACDKGYKVEIFTGDKDLLQLATNNITVNITKKGITQIESFTPGYLYEKMEIEPGQITDLKGLMGDSSDNLPGIPGVGEKTAIKLLKQYGTIENVFADKENIKGKLGEKIRDNFELGLLCKEIATIIKDAPIDLQVEDTVYNGYDEDELMEFYRDLEFYSFMKKEKSKKADVSVKVLNSDDIYELDKYLENDSFVSLEVFDDNYHRGKILGLSIVNKKGAFYIPFNLIKENMTFLPQWLADNKIKKSTYDYKAAKVALLWEGFEFRGCDFDILLASYVLNPNNKEDLESIGLSFDYDDVLPKESIFGKGTKKTIPDDFTIANYSVKKAIAVKNLKEELLEKLENNNQLDLFKMEMELAETLAKMEFEGVIIDIKELDELKQRFDDELNVLKEEVYSYANKEFNIGSPKQLGIVLFEELNLPLGKRTKTGYSTNVDTLNQLKSHHPIIEKILAYRTISKLVGTYIDGIKKVLLEKDGKFRVHTIFKQAGTATGRLSSIEPNMQNLPIKTELGKLIRKIFIPTEGNFLLGADYSQIELRVLAHMSKTDTLINAFREELDIHTETAMKVFKVNQSEVDSMMRRQAKAVNFGIIYGQGAWGLANELNITPSRAQEFIDEYFESFPGIRMYLEDVVQNAVKNGFSETIMNRRRYLPDLHSSNGNVRAFGERTAKNAPIQGSAADIIKKAMIDLDNEIEKRNLKSKLLIQVHDELIFDVPSEELEIMKELVQEIMENTLKLLVPLKVDLGYGKNLFKMK